MAVHEELRRHDIEPLAHVLAHALHRRTAAFVGAGGVGRLVAVLHALQVLGQLLAARAARRVPRNRRQGRRLRLQRGQLRLQARLVLDQRLGEQHALLGAHRLGLGAELPALQPRQLQLDLVQLRIAPGDLAVLVLDLGGLALELGGLARELPGLLGQGALLKRQALAQLLDQRAGLRGQALRVR